MATQKVDVAVVGAGIFGLAVAVACQRRGLCVRVVDAMHAGAGASGGLVGALSPHVPDQWNPKKAYQLEALLSGEAYWAGIGDMGGQPTSYARTGRLMPLLSAEARDLAKARSASAETLWQGKARWQVVEAGASNGWLASDAVPFGLIRETLSARIFPQQAMRALAAAFDALGGELTENWPVLEGSVGRLAGPKGQIEADTIVLAAGVPGFDLLAPLVGANAGNGVKGQAAVLSADCGGDEPVIFHDGIYIVPHGAGRVAVGSTSENTWDTAEITDQKLEAVIDSARAICPRLADAKVLTRWAGLRPKARRRDPMLGAIPGHQRLYAALGGFKIGFGLAPKVGETLADLITGTPTDLPHSFTVSHHL